MDKITLSTFFHDLRNIMSSMQVAIITQNMPKMENLICHTLERIADIEKMVDKRDLTELSLKDVIEKYELMLPCIKNRYNINIHFSKNSLDPNLRFYGVLEHGVMTLEELVRNAIKHGATEFWVDLDKNETHLILKFKDNGKGMSPVTLAEIGLRNDSGSACIRRMAMESSGLVKWESVAGLGTLCTVYLKLI